MTIAKTSSKSKGKPRNPNTSGAKKPDPLPQNRAPDTPAGWVAPGPTRFSVPSALVDAAPDAAKEIAASASFAADFGPLAPAPGPVADALTLAAAWSAEESRAEQYLAYAKDEKVRAWVVAREGIRSIAPFTQLVLERSPTVAARYPKLVKLLAVPRTNASRGAATKKKEASTAKKASDAKASAAPVKTA